MIIRTDYLPTILLVISFTVIMFLPGCYFQDTDNHIDQDKEETAASVDFIGSNDLPPYLKDRPELTDWSLWQSFHDKAFPTENHQFGGFGFGNGNVFSLVAVRPPFSTLHNIAGPTYQKQFKFFSDKTFSLLDQEGPVKWKTQRAYRIRNTAVILTRADLDELSFWTVDFAPRGVNIDETAAARTFFRTIIIHNRGTKTLKGLSLKVKTPLGSVKNGLIVETTLPNYGHMAAGFAPGNYALEESEKALTSTLPEIKPGGQFICRFLLAFSKDTPAISTFQEALIFNPEILMEQTIDSWKTMTDFGARIVTSNQRFDDLMEGLAQTMAVQHAAGGCFAQMSEYGYNALRDMYGITRFYPLIGRVEEYKSMLDYVWQVALQNGNISADVHIDLEFDSQPDEPDWENLPILTGRTRAESPSYLILMYKEYVNATGDWEPVEQRYGMLRHALIHQDFREECLLPFSDDETFRIAMMVAFGHSVFEGYEDKYLSANSSFLFVAAASFLKQAAQQLGYDEDALEYQKMADEVRECTEQYYWLDSGYYAPIIDIDTFEPTPQLFEDVNTKPLWLGYLSPEDEKARSNVLRMTERLEYKDGLFYSPVHPHHGYLSVLLGVYQGFVTGMAPGFQLDNFSRLDHPAAEDSFLLFDRFFHDTGNVSEGQTVDDFGRLAYLYEPFGLVADLTARFRSWEGSINAAAMIRYLFGLELDVPAGRIEIAPHLPKEWSFARMERARAGDVRFNMSVEDDGQVRRIVLDEATDSFLVDALVSLSGKISSITVNGKSASPEIENEWGRSRALLTDLQVSPQQPLIIEAVR